MKGLFRPLWYLLSIRPYRTLDNVIEGVVITFASINGCRRKPKKGRRTEIEKWKFFVMPA
jgi:hypothetical protein